MKIKEKTQKEKRKPLTYIEKQDMQRMDKLINLIAKKQTEGYELS